jgi:DNA-binding response OmpR family regulator
MFVTSRRQAAFTLNYVNDANGDETIIQAGELIVRPSQFMVSARGRMLMFSRREFEVLLYLTRHPGNIVSREDLHDAVWGGPYQRTDRSVDVYVHKVRLKLARVLPEWRYIHTHFGFGYRFQPELLSGVHSSRTTR